VKRLLKNKQYKITRCNNGPSKVILSDSGSYIYRKRLVLNRSYSSFIIFPSFLISFIEIAKPLTVETTCFRSHLNEFQRGQLGFKLKPIGAELAKQRKGALDFISDTAKAAIEKRWTEEKKMC
jgi:hypothetical protein